MNISGFIAWRAVVIVAAVYFYFLIFAQFAFLKLVEAGGSAPHLKLVMAAMGLSGLVGSLLTPWLLRRFPWCWLLRAGFLFCALAGLGAVMNRFTSLWIVLAGWIGLSLGVLTVTLVCHLRAIIGDARWGVSIGLGTGLAYFSCNTPWIFQAHPAIQALTASLVALMGCCLLRFADQSTRADIQTPANLAFGSVLVLFAMLVWFDSAAFFIIQNSHELVDGTWGGSNHLWRNALLHLGAAVAAGWWLEKYRNLRPAVWGFFTLAVAAWFVNSPSTLQLGGALYPVGVSLYSTCLVAYPAYILASNERRTWLAAVLFAVAGWIGSGMGIGMAENLGSVPGAFILFATILIATALGHRVVRRHVVEFGVCVVILGLGVILRGGNLSAKALARGSGAAQQGVEVYLSEGCIHCHTRYVRPRPEETLRWGPYVSYEKLLEEEPPLFGNRRQGPDLANVGLRRSRAWMKQHFIQPRLLAPDSVMPSYAYLFNDSRGEALINYLMQALGDFEERCQAIQAWRLPPEIPEGNSGDGRRLYEENCLSCHGEQGDGDGVLGVELGRRPANLRLGPFIHTASESAIPRVIKFGVMGSDMPGHEYFNDTDIESLAEYVRELRENH